MLEIIDKLFIFICCSIFYMQGIDTRYIPVPMLMVISLSCVCTYFENRKINRMVSVLFVVLCIVFPNLIFYLPVISYDLSYTEDWMFGMVFLIPFVLALFIFDPFTQLLLVSFLCLSYLNKYKTSRIKKLVQEYHSYRDNAKELEILLEEKNQKLLENQDVEVHLATLNERNRISKEIHDNIGHLISRSLIHIGALLTISKEENTKEGLHLLKDTLSEGMDSIRSSIHNIHDESIDLFTEVDCLVKGFCFCPISFDYSLQTSPGLPVKYFFIWTIKEALANIMRHSNGSNVSIVIMEHPIMYQLIIYDNGKLSKTQIKKVEEMNKNMLESKGMGIRNMIDRVQGFNGRIQFSGENGFKIFITIPTKTREGMNS